MQAAAFSSVLCRPAGQAGRAVFARHGLSAFAGLVPGARSESTEASPPSVSGRDVYVYTSPYGATVQHVKKLSLFSCLCAVSAGPLILGLDDSMSFAAKASLTATLAGFGTFTTGLLHWFVSPYVQTLTVDKAQGTVTAQTLTLWGTPRSHAFHLQDVHSVDSMHPLTSFEALGKRYYVDPAHFQDKELLARLVPVAAAEEASVAAKEEIEKINAEQ